MKVLFLKNVPRQGQVGEVKEVSQGFATYLLANGSVVVATDGVIKQNAKKIEESQMKAKGEESYSKDVAKKLDGQVISIKGGASSKGSLYKALHKNDILDATSKEIVVTVPGSLLEDVSIKSTGKHKINLVYKGKNLGSFQVEVV